MLPWRELVSLFFPCSRAELNTLSPISSLVVKSADLYKDWKKRNRIAKSCSIFRLVRGPSMSDYWGVVCEGPFLFLRTTCRRDTWFSLQVLWKWLDFRHSSELILNNNCLEFSCRSASCAWCTSFIACLYPAQFDDISVLLLLESRVWRHSLHNSLRITDFAWRFRLQEGFRVQTFPIIRGVIYRVLPTHVFMACLVSSKVGMLPPSAKVVRFFLMSRWKMGCAFHKTVQPSISL